MASLFEVLSNINVNGHTEQKSGLTYLSWAWAWAEVKKVRPDAHYEVWRNDNGLPYAYDPLTGFMVSTTVIIGEESHSMWLPVMDSANNAMKAEPYDYKVKNPNFKYAKYDKMRGGYFDKYGNQQEEFIIKHVEAATMFDVNKAIMRCLVKNLAMFGLGLYIYAGEDLPEGEADPKLEIKPSKEPTATDALRERPASQEAIQKILAAASESQKGAMFAKYGDKLEKLSEYGALQVMHKLGVA